MIKVLYITSTLKRTGPTNVMFTLISELDKQNFEPIVLTLSEEDANFPSLLSDFKNIEVKVISLSLSRLKGFVLGQKNIKNIVNTLDIDVIHIYGFRGDMLIRKSDYKGVKIISTINSNIYDDYTMLYGKVKGTFMAWLHMKSLKNKTAIGCSKFVADQLNIKYGSNLDVIYNGVSKNKYTVASDVEKLRYREQLGLPVDHLIFIFVGYLIYRKDPVTAINGFLKANMGEKSTLLILGDGPLREKCETIAGGNRNIIFLGNQPQTLIYLNASDYYIASSYSEGLPTSVMEALACGLPVLLSNIAPHAELVSANVNDQFMFDASDVVDLADKIKKISKELYNGLSMQAREIIEQRINSQIMAEMYQRLYK